MTEVAALTAEAAASANEPPAAATTVPTALPRAPAVWLTSLDVAADASPPETTGEPTGGLVETAAEFGASVVPTTAVTGESVLAAPTVESIAAMAEPVADPVVDPLVGPVESVRPLVPTGIGSTVNTGGETAGGGVSTTGTTTG